MDQYVYQFLPVSWWVECSRGRVAIELLCLPMTAVVLLLSPHICHAVVGYPHHDVQVSPEQLHDTVWLMRR